MWGRRFRLPALSLVCLIPLQAQTLEVAAKSYLTQIDTLTTQGRIDEARHLAKTEADRAPDQSLLSRAAAFEDRYGAEAPRYYKSLVEAMRSTGQPETVWRPAAERGMFASIRERQTASCKWFAALIASSLCEPGNKPADAATVIVPGGLRALMYMAGGPTKTTPASLADFSRTLTATQAGRDLWTNEAYRSGLIEYFRLLSELKTMGPVENGKTLVSLSLADSSSRPQTEHALNLLGWQSHQEAGKLVVDLATESPWARHRDLASALGADVVAMQEDLQSGKTFVLEIPAEQVAVFPSEAIWQSQFYSALHFNGGFAEALVRNPPMAGLYTALSGMEPAAASLLIQSTNMRTLAEKYAGLLTLYSSSLACSGGHVEVPGGDAAEPIWAAALGEAPTAARSDPQRFLLALLNKDEGRFLHFFFVLSQLDSARQRFFTANPKRTKAFYQAFSQSSQVEARLSRDVTLSSIEELFRELPIDQAGHVLFPGGPEVWRRAKYNPPSLDAKSPPAVRPKPNNVRLTRVTTPEMEDEILLRLIRNEYVHKGTTLGEWQNFLAVVRVESARPEPLDEASALLLAENYAGHRCVYGFLPDLTALDAAQYRDVLRLDEKIHDLDRIKGNVAAGMFQSALYMISAAEKSDRIAPPAAAILLANFAVAMSRVPAPAQWSHASLDFLRSYVDAVGAGRNAKSLCNSLVSGAATLRSGCNRVLELQNVPPLDDLMAAHASLLTLASMKGDPRAAVKSLVEISGRFKDVDVPQELKLPAPDRELLESSRAARFTALSAQMQKDLTGNAAEAKHLQRLAEDYWDALAFRTMIALSGQIYAVNFRPEDLLIADDPLFIRKHRFLPLELAIAEPLPSGKLEISNEAGGSRVIGGFDKISAVAGEAAAAGLRNVDSMSSFVASALLGSIRDTDWSRIDQAAVRGIAVRIHAAQDWLMLAATEPAVFDAVRDSTSGLISFRRRARVLAALERHDWDNVWGALSLTDLLFLADRLRERPELSSRSPSIDELKATAAHQTLAKESAPYESASTSHPSQIALRVAEFRIYLVRLCAEQAIPATTLSSVAESAARAVLSDVQMTNSKDWRAVLDAYEAFDGLRLREIVGTL